MLILPGEIIIEIIQNIKEHDSFYALTRTCKKINSLCNRIAENTKRKEFLKKISNHHEEYFVTPSGKREGEYKNYFSNGQLKEEGFFKENKQEGLWKHWNENGWMNAEINFENGKKEKIFRTWYRNFPQLSSESEYKNNKKHGYTKTWSIRGQLTSLVQYENGKRIYPNII